MKNIYIILKTVHWKVYLATRNCSVYGITARTTLWNLYFKVCSPNAIIFNGSITSLTTFWFSLTIEWLDLLAEVSISAVGSPQLANQSSKPRQASLASSVSVCFQMAYILMFLFSLFSCSGEDFPDHTLHVRQLWQHVSGRQLPGRLTSLSFCHSDNSKVSLPLLCSIKESSLENIMGRVQSFICEDNSSKLILNVHHDYVVIESQTHLQNLIIHSIFTSKLIWISRSRDEYTYMVSSLSHCIWYCVAKLLLNGNPDFQWKHTAGSYRLLLNCWIMWGWKACFLKQSTSCEMCFVPQDDFKVIMKIHNLFMFM